jgi:diguanylate cyclase (GGDEF)-like protein
VPLLKEQTVLGILNVEATHDRPLTEADVDLLMTLAGPVTVAIDNARLFEAEREQRELAEALRQVGAALSGSLDVETVLDGLLDQIARVVAYDTANVMLVAEGRARMARMRGYERFGEAVVQDTAALSFEVATTENLRRMADSGQPLIIPDTAAFPGWVRVKAADFIRSWAGAPIIAQGQVVAFFSIGKQELNFYQPEDAKRLAAFAGHAALALQNARLFEDTRRQVKELTVLQAVAAAGAEATDEDTLIERVTRVIGEMLYSDNCGVILLDEAAGVLRPHPSYHAPAEVKERLKTVPLGHGVTGQVAREGQARRVPDVARVLDYVVTEARMRSELCVPLKSGERVFGVINAESARADDFNEADERLLMTIAGQLATAIQNLRQFAATAESLARERRLNELARTLSGVLDLPSVLHSVVRLAAELVGGEGGALGLVAPDGERVNYPYLFNLPEGLRLQSAPKGQGLAWQIILTGASVLQTDYGSLPNALPQWVEAGVHGFIGVPVVAGEAHIGALGLFGLNPHKRFTPRDLALAESIGRQAGLAIQNARLFEQTQRRAAHLSALNEIGHAVSTLLEVDRVLEVIYQQVQRSLPLDVFFVSLYDAETSTVSNPFVMDGGQRYQEPLRPLVEDSHTGRTLRTAAPQLINCTEEELAAKAQHRHGIGDKARPAASMLFAPLLVGSRVIGVISAQSYSLQAFTDEHLALLTGVASQAAIAIENARLFGDEERRAKMLAALHATSLDITRQHDLPTLLRTIVERAVRLIGAPSGGLYLCDPDRQEARCMVSYNTWRDYSGTVLKYGEGAAGRVAQTRTPLIIEDYRLWSGRAAAYENQPFTAVLSVPMIWQAQVTGVIDVEYTVDTPGRFTPADLELLGQFANQAAIAVENARLLTETRRRADEQRLLYNAARDFTAGLSEEAVLQAIARHLVGALEAAGCAVSLWEPGQDWVVTLLDYDAGDGLLLDQPGEAYPLADYPATRRALEGQQPVVVRADDPEADPAECVLLQQRGNATVLLLPLGAGEEVFGLIELTRRIGAPPFSESDVRLGQSLAVEAGVALENARLHTTVQERVRELDALLTANSAMLSTLDLDPLLDNILQAALAAIPAAEKGTILLTATAETHDAAELSEPRLQIRALAGYTDPRVQTFAFAGSEGYSAKAVREKRPLLISDARADPGFRYGGDIPEVREILSAIAVPLMHHAHPLGAISLDATRRAAFTEADLRLLVAFANAAAVAIDNAQLHAEVRALAVTDGLTGLANHRAFHQALEAEVARAARYGYPVSLVFLDIDSFKLYNDTFGHPAGNVRLKAIAAHLRVREPDLAARYGGEEFAILLPHTPKDGALVVAEHIRAAAEAAAPERSAPGVPVSGYTFSLGVATFPDDGPTPEDLLLAADNAELAAKRAGKNRVVAATPLNDTP